MNKFKNLDLIDIMTIWTISFVILLVGYVSTLVVIAGITASGLFGIALAILGVMFGVGSILLLACAIYGIIDGSL